MLPCPISCRQSINKNELFLTASEFVLNSDTKMEKLLKNDTEHIIFENSGLNKAVGSRRSHALIILNMWSIFCFVLGNDFRGCYLQPRENTDLKKCFKFILDNFV